MTEQTSKTAVRVDKQVDEGTVRWETVYRDWVIIVWPAGPWVWELAENEKVIAEGQAETHREASFELVDTIEEMGLPEFTWSYLTDMGDDVEGEVGTAFRLNVDYEAVVMSTKYGYDLMDTYEEHYESDDGYESPEQAISAAIERVDELPRPGQQNLEDLPGFESAIEFKRGYFHGYKDAVSDIEPTRFEPIDPDEGYPQTCKNCGRPSIEHGGRPGKWTSCPGVEYNPLSLGTTAKVAALPEYEGGPNPPPYPYYHDDEIIISQGRYIRVEPLTTREGDKWRWAEYIWGPDDEEPMVGPDGRQRQGGPFGTEEEARQAAEAEAKRLAGRWGKVAASDVAWAMSELSLENEDVAYYQVLVQEAGADLARYALWEGGDIHEAQAQAEQAVEDPKYAWVWVKRNAPGSGTQVVKVGKTAQTLHWDERRYDSPVGEVDDIKWWARVPGQEWMAAVEYLHPDIYTVDEETYYWKVEDENTGEILAEGNADSETWAKYAVEDWIAEQGGQLFASRLKVGLTSDDTDWRVEDGEIFIYETDAEGWEGYMVEPAGDGTWTASFFDLVDPDGGHSSIIDFFDNPVDAIRHINIEYLGYFEDESEDQIPDIARDHS